MKLLTKLFSSLVLTLILFIISSSPASAHQPRLPQTFPVAVENPEVSKAYYAKLEGTPQVYTISESTPFNLYVNILVPDITNQKTDLIVTVVQKSQKVVTLAVLDGTKFSWKKFFEPFGHDTYLMGPEFRAKVPAGKYEITVSEKDNDSKYSLAIGETEAFDFNQTVNAITLIPKIKPFIFGKSPADFLLSPFGIGYLFIIFLLSFAFGIIYRFFMSKYAPGKSQRVVKNIGSDDKLIRFSLGAASLIIAVTTAWNPLLLFLSGFLFFEVIFSWCGFFVLFGRNTCPVKK